MLSKFIVPIVLQLLGVVVIIAEFLIPSAGLLSIVSIGLLAYSIYVVFTTISAGAGFIFLSIDIVLIPTLVVVGLKTIARSPAALRKTLSKEEGVSSQSKDLEDYLGKEGVSASYLRPAGIAQIEGKRLDVVTRGEFIDKNTPVVVAAITGNQIVVRKKEG